MNLAALPDALFIIGVMNRSGTNFLADLLLMHPALALPPLIQEDYLLFNAHLLDDYAAKTVRHWGEEARQSSRSLCAEILERFGRTLLDHARGLCPEGACPLLKTPRSVHLEYLPRLFPRAKALLVMRDGRDVVESATRTFEHAGPEEWMRRWGDGAKAMLEFMRANQEPEGSRRWKLVRYEDLFADTRAEISAVLEFLQLDAARYPWERIDALPLRGSSTARGGRAQVHWEPVERPKDFKPIGRWRSWGFWRKRLFKRIAGEELIATGYEKNAKW